MKCSVVLLPVIFLIALGTVTCNSPKTTKQMPSTTPSTSSSTSGSSVSGATTEAYKWPIHCEPGKKM